MLTFLVESPTVGPGSGSPLAIQFRARQSGVLDIYKVSLACR